MSERRFAKLMNASLSTVQERRKAGLLPRSARQDTKGHWLIDPVLGAVEWGTNAPLRVVQGEGGEALRAWRAARTRRETALAELAEDQLRKSRGELVPVADVVAKVAADYSSVKAKLLGIPSRLRQRDPGLTQGQIALVDELVREALEDLSEGKA